jgi:hypothetical protein
MTCNAADAAGSLARRVEISQHRPRPKKTAPTGQFIDPLIGQCGLIFINL